MSDFDALTQNAFGDSWWNADPSHREHESTSDWSPTHRISWRDHQGVSRYRDVMLSGTNLFSQLEWDGLAAPDWRFVSGRLVYRNQAPIFSDCRIEPLAR